MSLSERLLSKNKFEQAQVLLKKIENRNDALQKNVGFQDNEIIAIVKSQREQMDNDIQQLKDIIESIEPTCKTMNTKNQLKRFRELVHKQIERYGQIMSHMIKRSFQSIIFKGSIGASILNGASHIGSSVTGKTSNEYRRSKINDIESQSNGSKEQEIANINQPKQQLKPISPEEIALKYEDPKIKGTLNRITATDSEYNSMQQSQDGSVVKGRFKHFDRNATDDYSQATLNGISLQEFKPANNQSEIEQQENIQIVDDDQIYNSKWEQELLAERDKELDLLQSDVKKLNSCFKDISQEIYKQGEDLDLIEDNAEDSNKLVQEGEQQIEEANNSTKKSRKWIYILVILVFLLIAGVLLYVFKVF